MAVDINEPVKQGHDMILNYKEGEQRLGTASGFNREAKAGKLYNLPPNDNPNGDVNVGDNYGGKVPVDEAALRSKE